MGQKEEFLDAVSGGRENIFYSFAKGLVESVESGEGPVAGPGYSMKKVDSKIKASVLIRSERRFQDYTWEVPE